MNFRLKNKELGLPQLEHFFLCFFCSRSSLSLQLYSSDLVHLLSLAIYLIQKHVDMHSYTFIYTNTPTLFNPPPPLHSCADDPFAESANPKSQNPSGVSYGFCSWRWREHRCRTWSRSIKSPTASRNPVQCSQSNPCSWARASRFRTTWTERCWWCCRCGCDC